MSGTFTINQKEYFKNCGVDVMVFDDFYPAGHQSGIGIIMHGSRVATNGDLRFEATPGQWQPVPKLLKREVDRDRNLIKATLKYPDMDAHLRGFNPIIYPDFEFTYELTAMGYDDHVHVSVSMDKPVPREFENKLRFNMELFPGDLFGKSWLMDDDFGTFPRQPNGPTQTVKSNKDHSGNITPLPGSFATKKALSKDEGYAPIWADDIISKPLATGHSFTVRPEDANYRFTVKSEKNDLELFDGRINHNNGWFVISSPLKVGESSNVVEWDIYPTIIENWLYEPVVQVSAVGYHPDMPKTAVIELDERDLDIRNASIYRIGTGGKEFVSELPVRDFGMFLRYHYLQADFTHIKEPGLYIVRYKDSDSSLFRIDTEVFENGVWQPVLEYFLPVQMCHMRVNEKYKVWHGRCHHDDARMAPINYLQFDGASQGPSTYTKFKPGEHVPGLDKGGWHDAGDFDLRIESQTTEVYNLSLAYEEFGAYVDETTIDQKKQVTEIHQPDGKNDILQQIEHGLLSIIGAYNSMGRLYHEIMSSELRQYVLLGDAVNMTEGTPDSKNERWVFTEDNPERELNAASHLAAASRAMRDYDESLSKESLRIAREIYEITKIPEDAENRLNGLSLETWSNRLSGGAISSKINASVELYITTGEQKYLDYILEHPDYVVKTAGETGWIVSKIIDKIDNPEFVNEIKEVLKRFKDSMMPDYNANPYGIPYKPYIWGAGWGIQSLGVRNYFLHKAFPDIFDADLVYNALNFVLGCHPGSNKASFASGIGSDSTTTAYGMNRADWSYIPGGVISGTALIRPDFPELLHFPYLWQQTEYVIGGGSTNYLLLVLATRKLLGR